MKCSRIKLTTKSDYKRKNEEPEYNLPVFVNRTHDILRNCPKTLTADDINLNINTIPWPDNVDTFNKGTSLEKWSKKKPRLKSAATTKTSARTMYFDEYYDLQLDMSSFLDDLLNEKKIEESESEENCSLKNLQYELHSDIEELILKSQRDEENSEKIKRRRKCASRRKLKKTVNFSMDSGPEVEQVIRVDVTSNVSPKNKRKSPSTNNNSRLVPDLNRKPEETKSDEKPNSFRASTVRCIADEDDFVVRCKQLAIESKHLDD